VPEAGAPAEPLQQARTAGVRPRAALLPLAGWVLLFALAACWFWARPLLPFLVGALVLRAAAGARDNALARTARAVAGPVLLGITAVLAALVVLNLHVFGAVSPRHVHSAEHALAWLRLELAVRTHLSLWPVLILGSVLIVLAVAWRELPVARRVEQAKGGLGFVQLLLLALTSFVIYAQSPLQREVGVVHARAATQYRAALEREWSADAETVAARAFHRAVPTLTAAERARLRAVIPTAPRDPTAAATGLEEIATRITTRGAADWPAATPSVDDLRPREQARSVDPFPRTPGALEQQLHTVRTREAGADAARSRAASATALAVDTLVALVGLANPLQQEELRVLLDDLIDNVAAGLERRIAGRFLAADRRGAELRPETLAADTGTAAAEASSIAWLGRQPPARLRPPSDPVQVAVDRGFTPRTDPLLGERIRAQVDELDHPAR
jgi:hypothetical protein